jgi:hypothetical protein
MVEGISASPCAEDCEFPIHTETGLNSRTSSISFPALLYEDNPTASNFSGKRLMQLQALIPIEPVAPRSTIFMRINLRIY